MTSLPLGCDFVGLFHIHNLFKLGLEVRLIYRAVPTCTMLRVRAPPRQTRGTQSASHLRRRTHARQEEFNRNYHNRPAHPSHQQLHNMQTLLPRNKDAPPVFTLYPVSAFAFYDKIQLLSSKHPAGDAPLLAKSEAMRIVKLALPLSSIQRIPNLSATPHRPSLKLSDAQSTVPLNSDKIARYQHFPAPTGRSVERLLFRSAR